MADIPASLGQNSRYSHKSFAPSTHSWVHDPKITSGPPPPQPIELPSPVQALRPLPTPHAQNNTRTRGPLRVVNTPGPSNISEDQAYDYGPALYEPQPSAFDPSFGAIRPRKKKSFVGGFVKGIRKLPKTVFGYGAGTRFDNGKRLQHPQDVLGGANAASMSVTGMSPGMSPGNTLPLYTSNPATPVVPGPGFSGPSTQYRPQVAPIPESPLPSVVRLDNQRRHHPSFRVSPPSEEVDHGGNSQLFAGDNHYLDDTVSSNPADRTTVMVYNNDRETQYDRTSHPPRVPPPAPIVPRQLSSAGLSYVSSEPLAPLRPLSFHNTHPHAPAQIEIPQIEQPVAAAGPRVSYASQAPTPRAVPQSLVPGAVHSASSAHAHGHTPPPPAPQPQSTMVAQPPPQNPDPTTSAPTDPIQSPVSVHPTPGEDYLKMTLSSPSPTSHATITSGTSYYDPSFSSALNPVERFFKTLYHMPWVSHDRVTVDYHPGEGLGKMKKKKFRPATSWYHSMLSRSRRSSATLDLLSTGTGTEASARNSLGMSIALAFGSPHSGHRRRDKTTSDKNRSTRNKSHQQSSSRRHRHHATNGTHNNHHHRRRRRHTATTMDSTNTEARQADVKPVISPLIPPMYPFHYPPYPYPSFPTFPMPAPAQGMPHSGQENIPPPPTQKHNGDRPAGPRGPRGEHQYQQPVMYAPPGYAMNSYQPMMAPQVYVLSSPTTHMNSAGIPSAAGGDSAGAVRPTHDNGNGQHTSGGTSAPPGMVYMQTIPGAFA